MRGCWTHACSADGSLHKLLPSCRQLNSRRRSSFRPSGTTEASVTRASTASLNLPCKRRAAGLINRRASTGWTSLFRAGAGPRSKSAHPARGRRKVANQTLETEANSLFLSLGFGELTLPNEWRTRFPAQTTNLNVSLGDATVGPPEIKQVGRR